MPDGTYQHPKCWARSLGGCDEQVSREHIISRALFPAGVKVQGLDWCKDEPKELGAEQLVARILCVTHNNGLSPLDSGARDVWATLIEAGRVRDVRDRNKGHRWSPVAYRLNGPVLERWSLKTICNVFTSGSFGEVGNWEPTAGLVRFIFAGGAPPSDKAGLGMVVSVGDQVSNLDHLRFSPVSVLNVGLVGATISLRGYKFVCTWEVPVDRLLVGDTLSMRHPNRINLDYDVSVSLDWSPGFVNDSNRHVLDARRRHTEATAHVSRKRQTRSNARQGRRR